MSDSHLSRAHIVQYGFLAAPVAFAGFPLYVLAPDFYATHYGVTLSLLGVVLLCLRCIDAVQDLIIGWISDRFSRAALPLMLVSGVVLIVSIYALFNPSGAFVVPWFIASMFIAVTAYSILSINLNALGALWTSDRQEQTRITAVREACGLLGLILAVTLPTVLKKYVPEGQVFVWFSAILGVLMAMALMLFSRWFLRNVSFKRAAHVERQNLWALLRTLPKQTRALFLVYGVSILASSIPAVLVLFFTRDLLHSEAYTGVFLLLYFLSGALAMPLWKRLSGRYGKHRAWLMSMLLAVASFIWAFFLSSGDAWQYAVICAASGMALGADLALPPSILADHIHDTHAEASAATQFSLLTLLSKAGLAVGSAIALPFLTLVGFVPAAYNDAAALAGLSIAYALIPCFIKLFSAYLLYHFFVTSHAKPYDTARLPQ